MNARTTSMALLTVIAAAGAVLALGERSSGATPEVNVNTMDASATDTWDASRATTTYDASRTGAWDASVNSTTGYDASALQMFDANGPTVAYEAGK